MAQVANQIEVYLEIGQARTFAVAIDWPGWCRSGRDQAAALQALCDYGPRYARALETTQLGFLAPPEASELVVDERLPGNRTHPMPADAAAPENSPSSGSTQPLACRQRQLLTGFAGPDNLLDPRPDYWNGPLSIGHLFKNQA